MILKSIFQQKNFSLWKTYNTHESSLTPKSQKGDPKKDEK